MMKDIIVTLNTGETVSYYSSKGYPMVDLREKFVLPFPLITADVGAGGDCFFHSISFLLNMSRPEKYTYMSCRANIADYVNTQNRAEDVLTDMAGQWPTNVTDSMAEDHNRYVGLNPVKLWNHTITMPAYRKDLLQAIIKRQGNTYWGDSTTISIAELVYGINIAIMSIQNKRITISRYMYGVSKLLAEDKPLPPMVWDAPVYIILNHSNYHWTPILVPSTTVSKLNYFMDPEDFKSTFHDILKDS